MLLLIGIIIFDMALKRKLVLTKSPFLIYLLYACLATIVSGVIFTVITGEYSMTDSIQRMLRDVFYFSMALFFAPISFDFDYGIRIMRKIIFITGVFIFIQFIVYSSLHVYIPGIIPWMKTTISGGVTGGELIERFARNADIDGFARPNGFFSEPAVIAQFVSVGLILELFSGEGKKNIKISIFYSFVMLITFSVNAYVALAVIWSLWVLFINRNNRDIIIRVLLLITIMIVALVLMMHNTKTASVINRLIMLMNGNRISGSSVIRVVRGMAFYFKMPLLYQIFGSGFGNFIQFKDIYDITTIYETVDEYMNTNAYILVSSGIVGFVLYLVALIRESRGSSIAGMIAAIMFVFGISSSIYSSAVYVIMLAFLITAPRKDNL